MNRKRRTFLKGTMAGGSVALAVGAGLLTPNVVLAAWPKPAFEAKSVSDAMSALVGNPNAANSGEISVKSPDIAENGTVVPVTVDTNMAGVESISILAAANALPLAASFNFSDTAKPYVSTRIKMGKTSKVIAVVKTKDGLFQASKNVKVTIGGCGG